MPGVACPDVLRLGSIAVPFRRKKRVSEKCRNRKHGIAYCFLMLFLAVLMNRPNDLSFFRFSP